MPQFSPTSRRGWSWRRRHNRSGQILVIVLLGMVLLAGLIVYVVNVGTQVNNRLGMQNAADSAAISGATWMARSMNLIAMNNVAQTRMLALVPILDAFPLATAMTYDETTQWSIALKSALDRGVQSPYALEPQFIAKSLAGLDTDMRVQVQILQGMNTFFNDSANGYDVSQLTFWQIDGRAGPPPHGQLWQAATALKDVNTAVNDTSGVLSQAGAVRYGRGNGAQTSFLVPILPDKPGRQGTYSDFTWPIRGQSGVGNPPFTFNIPDGTIPDRYPPYTPLELIPLPLGERYRLGPFDRLFRWRHYIEAPVPGGVPVQPGVVTQPTNGSDNFGGGSVLGASASSSAGPSAPSGIVPVYIGYSTYGPYRWMMDQTNRYADPANTAASPSTGGLWASRFGNHFRTIANYKLGYLFPWQPSDRDPKSIHYPQWVAGYPEAMALAANQPQTIYRTAYILLSISSRFPREDPMFLSPGSFVTNNVNGRKTPAMFVPRRWYDPNAQNRWERLCNYIWVWTPETAATRTTPWGAIGLTIPLDTDGKPVAQPVYVVRYFVFVAVDVGQNMEVRNPANWTDVDVDNLPGPMLIEGSRVDSGTGLPLDHNIMQQTHDQGMRRGVFTYLGLCQADNAAAVWSQKFGRPGPYDGVVGVAQAEVFNTTSWDLWTQDWKVKLTPVSDMPDWVRKMASDSQQAGNTQGQVRGEDVDRVREYLEKFDPAMVDDMMQH